jgi:hypothetical protein
MSSTSPGRKLFQSSSLQALHSPCRPFCTLLLVASLGPLCTAQGTLSSGRTQTQSQTQQGTQQSSGSDQQQQPTMVLIPPPQIFDNCPSFPSSSSGESERRAQVLDKLGPQVPPLYTMSNFSVMGFSKGNWPIVIDYVLDQDSLVLVVIAPEGQKPQLFRLDGKKGHWQTRLQLPPEMGSDLRVSQYVIQTLDSIAGAAAPSRVHIRGIAAGPQAVGSIGIDQVTFGPGTIRLAQHEKVQYSFHSMFDFKNTQVTFVRLAKSSDGGIIAGSVGEKSTGSVTQNARKNGDWDGSTKPPDVVKSYPPDIRKWLTAPNGEHTLQVRAWYGAKDGGDWVTALSGTIVSVQ